MIFFNHIAGQRTVKTRLILKMKNVTVVVSVLTVDAMEQHLESENGVAIVEISVRYLCVKIIEYLGNLIVKIILRKDQHHVHGLGVDNLRKNQGIFVRSVRRM